jgi:hypothetical protein
MRESHDERLQGMHLSETQLTKTQTTKEQSRRSALYSMRTMQRVYKFLVSPKQAPVVAAVADGLSLGKIASLAFFCWTVRTNFFVDPVQT